MKPIKPKKMSKLRLTWIEDCSNVGHIPHGRSLSVDVARAILAALEYERQRAASICRKVYEEHASSSSYPMDMGGLALECATRIESDEAP